jgi:ankyrin repeat protein
VASSWLFPSRPTFGLGRGKGGGPNVPIGKSLWNSFRFPKTCFCFGGVFPAFWFPDEVRKQTEMENGTMILFNFFTRGFLKLLPVGILFSPVFSAPVSGQHAVLTPKPLSGPTGLVRVGLIRPLMAATYFEDQSVRELCEAISRKEMPRFESLLNECSDPNARGKDGVTPLLWALNKRNEEAFRLLLEKGADPNIQVTDTIPYGVGHRRTRAYLKGDSVTSLAASRYKPTYLQAVLQHRGNPNLMNPISGSTPLYDTIRQSTEENISRQVSEETNARQSLEKDAFRQMFKEKEDERLECFKALIAAGADINYRVPEKDALLLFATKKAGLCFVRVLFENGADFYVTDKDGRDFVVLLYVRYANASVYPKIKSWLEENGFAPDTLPEYLRTLAEESASSYCENFHSLRTMKVTLPIEERPWLPQPPASRPSSE